MTAKRKASKVLTHPEAQIENPSPKEFSMKTVTQSATKVNPRPRFCRALDSVKVEQIERDYDRTNGTNRRLMQVVLTKSSAELLQAVTELAKDDEGMDAMTAMLDNIESYRKHLECGAKLARAAQARVLACVSYLASREEAVA